MTIHLLGQDFDCVGIPSKNTEASLLPLLNRRIPLPSGLPPKFCDSINLISDSLARFSYFGITQGYGEFADFLYLWKISGMPITVADTMDLDNYCHTRFQQVLAVYENILTALPGVSLLSPRPFHAILDQSEKAVISYALGSAVAGAVAYYYFLQRGDGVLLRLFHRRLIDSPAHAMVPATIVAGIGGAIPDYIGVTKTPGGYSLHVLETKLHEKCDYAEIRKGLKQAQGIWLIDGQPPESCNLLFSHLRSSKKKRYVMTSMLRLKPLPVIQRSLPAPGPALSTLNGVYGLGLSTFLFGISDSIRYQDEYGYFNFAEGKIKLAIRKEVLERLNQFREQYLAVVMEELPQIVRLVGEFLREEDPQPYDRPAVDDNWVAVEGQWLWMRSLAGSSRAATEDANQVETFTRLRIALPPQ
jgi:hypothetical protein